MKKSLVALFAFVSAVLMQAMDPNPLSMLLHNTVITLHRGSLLDVDGKVDLIAVGRNQQQKLQSPDFTWPITKMNYNNRIIYERNKDDESDSEDDTYKPFFIDKKQESWKKPDEKIMTSKIIMVTESVVGADYGTEENEGTVIGVFWQSANEFKSKRSKSLLPDVAFIDNAMDKLVHDLGQCYKNILCEGLKVIGDKEDRSLAIPTLGTEVGITHKIAAIIAVKSIKEFIEKNPGAYARIELYMKKKFELYWYDMLFSLDRCNKFLGLTVS